MEALRRRFRVVVFGVDTAVGAAVAYYLGNKSDVYEILGVKLTINNDPLELKTAEGLNPELEGEVPVPRNVTMCPCNLDLQENIENIIRGADACFVNTFSNFYNPQFMSFETQQGQMITKACKNQRIPHTVFCTQPHTLDHQTASKGRMTGARHMVAKAETEEYMRVSQIPCSFVVLPRFYEEILQFMGPEKIDNFTYKFELPISDDLPLNMMTMEDIGHVVEKILMGKPANTRGPTVKPVRPVGDKVMRKELAAGLNENLSPLRFKDCFVSNSHYRNADVNKVSRRPWREDYADMFEFLSTTKYDRGADLEKDSNVNSYKKWVQDNAKLLKEVFAVQPHRRLKLWFNNVVYRHKVMDTI